MKKPKLPNLKGLFPQSKPRKPMKRLAAHASRLTQPAYEDYDEEPTTKLSTAFVVVLVLHLVAVGGIYAFHSIKAKRREADGTAVLAKEAAAKSDASTHAKAAAPAATPAASAASATSGAPAATPPIVPALVPVPMPSTTQGASTAKTGGTQSQSGAHLPAPAGPSAVLPQPATASKQVATQPAAAGAVPAKNAPAETAPKGYTVVKGDNPVAIAKKFGVNYDEMLKINGIEDPKKLRIGQVLKMPVKKQAAGN